MGAPRAFSRVSSTTFPEFRCVIGHPEDGYSSGGSVGIKGGETQIQNTRWGDYIGGGWREGQSDPECWVWAVWSWERLWNLAADCTEH